MEGVYCPECDGTIVLNPTPQVGKRFTCPHCDADLEIISVDPVEVDWVFEDPDADWGDDED